ncbi:hypothetical protein ACFV1W_27535 [Kitasatospora sp. NPDC059648]|uniref:hypothetical protein n=1 Tax=Kitasatospora sp. NPDC059648 TaxID=3346894 RepID=UPI0036921501
MAARFGSAKGGRKVRLGKRVTGTAAAFAALAALTGSQVSGLGLAQVAAADAGPAQDGTAQGSTSATPFGGPATGVPGVPGTAADGGSAVQLPQPPGTQPGQPAAGPFTATGAALPATVFAAYRQAEASLAQHSPVCHLPWQLLAAIGQVESGQANGGQVDAAGRTLTPILGPVLDGNGFAAIPDTDGGRYDGDSRWDRAVGPMQFIPSTWASWGVDATGKGTADPNNIFDAAETAGRYLCAGGRDLSDPSQLDRAVLSYNDSTEYLRTVRNWMAHFGSGQVTTVPDLPGIPGAPVTSPSPFLRPSGTTAGTSGGTPTGNEGTGTSPTPNPQPTVPPVTPAQSPAPTPTTTPSAQPTTTPTPSGSPSPSASPTATPSGSPSPTASPTGTPSGTPTGTPTSCPSPTATATPTGTAAPSGTPSPTATPSGTPSATPTAPGCPTPTPSGSPSATPSAGASATPSSSLSPSPTAAAKK